MPLNGAVQPVVRIVNSVHQLRDIRRCWYRLAALEVQEAHSQVDSVGIVSEHLSTGRGNDDTVVLGHYMSDR